MMKNFFKYIIALSFTASSSAAVAVEVSPIGSQSSTPPPATAAEAAAGTSTSKAFQAASAGVETSVNQAADTNQSNNSMGQMMSTLTGGMYISSGTANIQAGQPGCCNSHGCPGCPQMIKGIMEVAMGVLSLKQAGESGKAAGASGITGMSTDGLGSYDTANTDMALIGKDSSVKAIQSNLNKLKDMGVYDPKSGTFKVNGKEYNVSDFSSKQAMVAAGLPAGAYAGMLDYAKKAEQKAKEKLDKLGIGSRTAANGFDEGGGGGLGGTAPDSYGDSSMSASAGLGANPHRIGLDRDPSSLAGMQKNYNGDPIGVAADSIFLMMTRRYKVKESQESFYNQAEMDLKK